VCPAADKVVTAAAIDRVHPDQAPDVVALRGALQNIARRRAYDLRHTAIFLYRLMNTFNLQDIIQDRNVLQWRNKATLNKYSKYRQFILKYILDIPRLPQAFSRLKKGSGRKFETSGCAKLE
jgi:hypothetical protein